MEVMQSEGWALNWSDNLKCNPPVGNNLHVTVESNLKPTGGDNLQTMQVLLKKFIKKSAYNIAKGILPEKTLYVASESKQTL